MPVLQSLIADRWVGSREGAALASAIDGATVYHAHADELDFAEDLSFARRAGAKSLLALDFQQRAARLKAIAAYLNERKEELYAISRHTGATRSDGWVEVLLPVGGVSGIDVPGGPFADPDADEALFAAVREGLAGTDVPVTDWDGAINDPGFGRLAAERLHALITAEGN